MRKQESVNIIKVGIDISWNKLFYFSFSDILRIRENKAEFPSPSKDIRVMNDILRTCSGYSPRYARDDSIYYASRNTKSIRGAPLPSLLEYTPEIEARARKSDR